MVVMFALLFMFATAYIIWDNYELHIFLGNFISQLDYHQGHDHYHADTTVINHMLAQAKKETSLFYVFLISWLAILFCLCTLAIVLSRYMAKLRTSEQSLLNIIENSNDFIGMTDKKGNVRYINPAGKRMIGLSPSKDVTQHRLADWHSEETVERLKKECIPHAMAFGLWSGELDFVSSTGEIITTSINIFPHQVEGEVQLVSCIARDITEQKEIGALLKVDAMVFEAASEAIIITDKDNCIVNVNQAFTRITGYFKAEVLGRNPRILSSGEHSGGFYQEMFEALKNKGSWQGEVVNRRKNGERYTEWLSIVAVKPEAGVLTHHVAVFSDITERKLAEDLIRHQAMYDQLTDLPNRALFIDRVKDSIMRAERSFQQLAILFMDLDGFKAVNDQYGHAMGDKLLKTVGQLVRQLLRKSDTLARIGGDEFAVLLVSDVTEEHAIQVAKKIIALFDKEIQLDNIAVKVGVSIGVSIYPEDSLVCDDLIKKADVAMYYVKEHGKNNYRLASSHC